MIIGIFSDLHIPNHRDARYSTFLSTLRKLKAEGLTDLWLLGDIFDLMVGPFEFWTQMHNEVFQELRAFVKAGGRLIWLEGNHDFHLDQHLNAYFASEVVFGTETRSLEIPGPQGTRKILLSHGDLVNQEDLAYLKWRTVIHHPRLRRMLSHTPSWIAHYVLLPLAEKLSHTSRARERDEAAAIRTLYRNEAHRLFSAGWSGVLMGHCHVEDLYCEGGCFYLNTGSWLGAAWPYAVWEPEKELFPKLHFCPKIEE